MGQKQTPKELILKTIQEKSVIKQGIYKNTCQVFNAFKEEVRSLFNEISASVSKLDSSIKLEFVDKDDYEFRIRIAADLLIFYQHSNVFSFDPSHSMYKTTYIKEDDSRAYFGIINVYNFLGDSFDFNRMHDLGYLIGRIFINKDNHYFVEGKRQLGFLYNDLSANEIKKDNIKNITESILLYCLNFDLYTPPYDHVKEVSVEEFQVVSSSRNLRTGKRLGFKFSNDGFDM